ncbi:unnamed protein product, partial [Amoebophrya sp. A25]
SGFGLTAPATEGPSDPTTTAAKKPTGPNVAKRPMELPVPLAERYLHQWRTFDTIV